MDCSALLAHVRRAEAALVRSSGSSTSSQFGHTVPPTLHLLQLTSHRNLFLAVARTKRACSAQVLVAEDPTTDGIRSNQSITTSSSRHPRPPLAVWYLVPPTAEGRQKDDDSASTTTFSTSPQSTTRGEEELITCSQLVPLTSESNLEGGCRAAVILGTSYSRVLCIELIVCTTLSDASEPMLQLRRADDMAPFEPLPLDTPKDSSSHKNPSGTSIQYSRHGIDSTSVKSGSTRQYEDDDGDTTMTAMSGSVVTHGSESHISQKSGKTKKEQEDFHAFSPIGGVTSLSIFANDTKKNTKWYVWVAYKDGTTIRLPQTSFFWSCFGENTDDDEHVNGTVRTQMQNLKMTDGSMVVPLPKHHPSPLAPMALSSSAPSKRMDDDDLDATASPSTADSGDGDNDYDDIPEFHEALAYGLDFNNNGTGGASTLSFYTSEDHRLANQNDFWRPRVTQSEHNHDMINQGSLYSAIGGHLLGGTKAIAGGLFGVAIGAVKWGLGTTDETDIHEQQIDDSQDNGNMLEEMDGQDHESSEPVPTAFPRIHEAPRQLSLGLEINDSPRQISSITVDPDGKLAATVDTLGRVLLVDLPTKQVVRMWKGVREAACYWMEMPRPQQQQLVGGPSLGQQKKITYLVIHARQRRVVEVWRMRHGLKIKSMSVGRDMQVVQYTEHTSNGHMAKCILFHLLPSGGSRLESLLIEDPEVSVTALMQDDARSPGSLDLPSSFRQGSAIQLQLLQQLLSETNVPTSVQAVYHAFTKISSLSDLSIALDFVAIAPQLEDSMGVDGSSFQLIVVAHCKEKLETVLQEGEEDIKDNPHFRALSGKIEYHTQVIDAYDVLYKFEQGTYNKEDEEKANEELTTPWAEEAIEWMKTFQTVTGIGIDDEVPADQRDPLHFSTFAKACCDSGKRSEGRTSKGKKHAIYLSDSKKTRTGVLVHIFRPLLQDLFVFKTVRSIFECLGVKDDGSSLQTYFGEWFMTLRAMMAAQKSFFDSWRPMVRWLQKIVSKELDDYKTEPDRIPLNDLHVFCSKNPDLPRSFLLASICREAISVSSGQKESKTYGQITRADCVKPWDELLRKLRICLLISLRLNGLPLGPFPITVKNIDDGHHSVFELVARDELLTSYDQGLISAFESSLKTKTDVFHPSTPEGDLPFRWKAVQASCVAAVSTSAAHSPNATEGTLMTYLSDHVHPLTLACHRGLLLGGKWGQQPDELQLLANCVSTLRALHTGDSAPSSVAYAVRLEVWQTRIRPIFRAIIFGFHDVPELSEDIMAPLCLDSHWRREFSKLAHDILTLITHTPWIEAGDRSNNGDSKIISPSIKGARGEHWPPVTNDFILDGLVSRSHRVHPSALEVHTAILCAARLSDEIYALELCLPDTSEVFLQSSLFQDMPPLSRHTEEQMNFIMDSIAEKAQKQDGQIIFHFPLDAIEQLGQIWGVSEKLIRTRFLINMYELGKDSIVDELTNSSSSQHFDVSLFVEDGLKIACRRLNSAILTLKKVKRFRNIIGLLDADICQWVKQQAESNSTNHILVPKQESQSLSSTHAFILRMLQISPIGTGTTEKVHALSIMSGTLLKAIEESDVRISGSID